MTDGYLAVDAGVEPGAGITTETMQFHGTADRYALAGATAVATLYSSATASTGLPAVTLRSDAHRSYRVDALDLHSLVVSTLDLASAPQFAGALGGGGDARVWVTQEHPAGRISFVDLAARTVRTATGYELNADIDR